MRARNAAWHAVLLSWGFGSKGNLVGLDFGECVATEQRHAPRVVGNVACIAAVRNVCFRNCTVTPVMQDLGECSNRAEAHTLSSSLVGKRIRTPRPVALLGSSTTSAYCKLPAKVTHGSHGNARSGRTW